MQTNLVGLSQLTMQLRRYLNDGDFTELGRNGDLVRDAYQLLRNAIPRLG